MAHMGVGVDPGSGVSFHSRSVSNIDIAPPLPQGSPYVTRNHSRVNSMKGNIAALKRNRGTTTSLKTIEQGEEIS